MRRVSTLTAVLVMAAVAARLTGQQPQPPKPGPELDHCKQLEGTWDATMKFMGAESKGTMIWKMDLGGLWLLEHFKGDFGGMPFEGRGATTYDPAKKKYVNVWIDSMTTSPMISEGTFNPDKKTMSMTGTMTGPDGKSMKHIMTSQMIDNNNILFTMRTPDASGKEEEMFTITYKRRAK